MAKCSECNSVIADGEPFCGVCGLAVPKAAAAGFPATQETEDPFEGTIVMAPEELARQAAEIKTTRAEAEPEIDPTAVPTPAILDKATSESLDVRSTADYKLEKATTKDAIDAGTGFVDFGLPETYATNEPAKEGAAADNEATTAKTPLADADELIDAKESDEGQELVSEIHSSREPVIAKPDVELPIHEFASSNPIYDSVRIVAPDVPESQDFISTRIPTQGDLSMPASEKEPPTTKSEPRAYTSPNIGEGETDGRKTGKLKPLTEGAILNGRYEIIRKIGGGGMGAVYLASDNNLGGVLRAVKEMIQAHIEEEQQEKAINDFKRESMILSSLDHPSIPTIFDYFYDEAESRFFMVIKYI